MSLSDYDPAALPGVVLAYLDAHDAKQHDRALATFAADAQVIDDGRSYRGTAEIDEWLRRTAGEYTYESTRTGQRVAGVGEAGVGEAVAGEAMVAIRLDGDFPGGTVALKYVFALADGLITRLEIGV